MQLRLIATPRIAGSALRLENIDLGFTRGATLSMRLRGEAHWHGAADAAATLTGSVEEADAGRYDLSAQLTPANQQDPLLLALRLDGPGNHIDLRLPPLGLAHWWSQLADRAGPQLSVPPGSGSVQAEALDVAGVHVEGLQLQFEPAPATSAAATKDTGSR